MCKHLISAFYKTTNTPAPPLLCLVRNRRVGKGEARTAPGTIKSRGGHRLILSPSLSKVFCFFCCDFFMLEKKHNRATREKTGHGKTGYFHGNDNERKQHYIHWEIQRSLVKILLFLSVVGVLIHYYYLSSYSWNMILPSNEHHSSFFFCHFSAVSVELYVESSKPHNQKSLYIISLWCLFTQVLGRAPQQTYRHL